MMEITRKQIVKSAVFTAIGAAPGIIWFFSAGTVQPVVVACLCGFVGFALSLPGVSAARVAGGTAGVLVAYNAPRAVRGKIIDAMVGENEEPEGAEPGPDLSGLSCESSEPDFSFLDDSKKDA